MGVDSSTQSCKVQIRDADDGTLVASGRAPHPPTSPPRSEQDPAAWWAALRAACDAAGPAVAQVAAISVGGQQHGLVVLDEGSHVLRPAKLWNDTESAVHAAGLVAQLGAPRWAEATGSVPVASFTVTKLAWLAEHEPDVLARTAHVLLPHDWLTHRLTGRFTTDRGDASGTGYWSPTEGAWRPDLLALAAPRLGVDALPEVLGPTEVAGHVTAEAGAALGLPEGAVVACGTGDNMAAALGVALRPGDVAVSLGTSGTVYAVADRPVADATGAVAGFADATGRFLPLVCTRNATQVTDTVARLLGVDHAQFDDLALDAPPGASGLVLLPYLDGERTPNRPAATGVLSGMRTAASRADLARAAVEGVGCGLLDGLDALAAAGVPTGTGRLLVVGGGSRSRAYREILATLAGRVVEVPGGDEHVATGAAAQAAAVVTGHPPLEVAAAWAASPAGGSPTIVTPVAGGAPEAVRERYAALRDRTVDPA